MRSRLVLVIVLLVAAAFASAPSRAGACTTFLMTVEGRHYLGKSYDWDVDVGQVIANKRGVAKEALPVEPAGKPARWVSKYASLSFNQYGREMPNGGINEAGLVVEIMWLAESQFPESDPRPAVSELQWIQYQLDSFATVAEMVKAAPGLRVYRVYGKVHYLACDRSGACAAFEYLGGKLQVTTGDKLRVKTLTNDSYENSAAALGQYQGFGGKRPIPKGIGSIARFVRASFLSLNPKWAKLPSDGVQAAFLILDRVAVGDSTKWNIVYDLQNGQINFRSHRSNKIKRTSLSDFDPSCAAPVKWLDINSEFEGGVGDRFQEYSAASNRRLIQSSLEHIRSKLPPDAVEQLASYPERLPCVR